MSTKVERVVFFTRLVNYEITQMQSAVHKILRSLLWQLSLSKVSVIRTNVKLTPSLRSRSPTIFKAEIRAAGVIGVRGICMSAKHTQTVRQQCSH